MKIELKKVKTVKCIEYWMRKNVFELIVDGRVEGVLHNVFMAGHPAGYPSNIHRYLMGQDDKMRVRAIERDEASKTLRTWRQLAANC